VGVYELRIALQRKMLGHRQTADRQLCGELGRGARRAAGDGVQHGPARRVGERGEDGLPGLHAQAATSSGLSCRRASGGCHSTTLTTPTAIDT